jgi:hypothetical protein
VDTLRPHGLAGPLVQRCRGRDLFTDHDGRPVVRHEAGFDTDADPAATLISLRTQPAYPELDALAGTSLMAGFRGALHRAAPWLADSDGPLHQLLDELPVATLISWHAIATELGGEAFGRMRDQAANRDLCAGWADGATMMNEIDSKGYSDPVRCPDAPSVHTDDPWAWHQFDALPAHGMRRLRRIDVRRDGDDLVVDGFFRDSHADRDARETVLHEYQVAARVRSNLVTACDAVARTLPYGECPAALASTARVVGQPVAELREYVRAGFTGTSTCTHLNDTLRALADVPRLARLLD